MARFFKYAMFKLIIIMTTLPGASTDVFPNEINSTDTVVTNESIPETTTSEIEQKELENWRINRTQVLVSTEAGSDAPIPDSVVPVSDNSDPLLPNIAKILYFWDKTSVSPKDFQQSYCPRRCINDQVVSVNNFESTCPGIFCFPCECKRPECEIYGICCPDFFEPYISLEQFEFNNKFNEEQQIEFRKNVSELEQQENSDSLLNTTMVAMDNSKSLGETTKLASTLPLSSDYHDLSGSEQISKNRKNKSFPKLECDEHASVLNIRSCPREINVSLEVVRKCEAYLPENEFSLETITLVTDNKTGVVYYNKFCAECNNVSKNVSWQIEIECASYMSLYTARTNDELLRQSLKLNYTCSIQKHAPDGFNPTFCDQQWYSNNTVVDTCNVTGQWRVYDEDVVRSCATLDDQIYQVLKTPRNFQSRSDQFYQNIFCAICNKKHYPVYTSCLYNKDSYPIVDGEDGIASDANPHASKPTGSPFSMLFGLRNRPLASVTNRHNGHCTSTEWTAPSGSCLPMTCSPGKVLYEDGNCSTALTQITGLGYKLRLWFVPQLDNGTKMFNAVDDPPSSIIFKHFYGKLLTVLDPLAADFELTIGSVVNISTMADLQILPSDSSPADYKRSYIRDNLSPTFTQSDATSSTSEISNKYSFQIPYLYWVSGLIVARQNTSRDVFEEIIIDKLLQENINIEFADDIVVNFKPIVMWHNTDVVTYCSDINKINTDVQCYERFITTAYPPYNIQYPDVLHLFINISKVLTCKYVSFQESQYVIENTMLDFQQVIVLKLNINATILTFTNELELSLLTIDTNGALNICCELLNEKLVSVGQLNMEANLMNEVQYVLTLVCMSVSMLCLLLTVATYAQFPGLRSVAGRNNMCLSASLLLAQAALLASVHTDVDSIFCVPLGVITHFTWLSMFSWSLVCCFNMYKVFTAKTRNLCVSPRSQIILLMKYVTFTLVTPTIIIVTVVVVVYVTSDGQDIGYGIRVCYLNSYLLVATAMIGPLALVTCCNVFFFLATVLTIYRIQKLQKYDNPKKDDQKNLYVYIKLSTMTGAFWVTYIIAENTNVDGLKIITIILNGLQGVFIFMSYVCNERVLTLYLKLLGIRKTITTTSGSTTERSTISRSSPKKSQNSDTMGSENTELSISSGKQIEDIQITFGDNKG